jgi:hypothetical protein
MKTTAAVKQTTKTATVKSSKLEKHDLAFAMLKQMMWSEGLKKGLTKGHWMVAAYQLIEDELLERGEEGKMTMGVKGINEKKINVHFTSNNKGLYIKSEVMSDDSIRL